MRKGTFKAGKQEYFLSAENGEVISMESKPKIVTHASGAIRQIDRTHIFVRNDDGKERSVLLRKHLNNIRAGSRVAMIFAGKSGSEGRLVAIQAYNPAGVTEVAPLSDVYDPFGHWRMWLFLFGIVACFAHGVGILIVAAAGVWQWYMLRKVIIFDRMFKALIEELQ